MGHVYLVLAQSDSSEGGVSLISLLMAGGLVGYIIMLLSVVAVALVVVHLIQLREEALAPAELVEELDAHLRGGRVREALDVCQEEDTECLLTRVMEAGLLRFTRSAFGALELKAALEEAGQAESARLHRATDGLALIAAIAPMLGLLGTVVGMVGAFDTISASEGFARPDQLAGDISKALVTTLMGLSLAIPATAALTYFRNRIDGLVAHLTDVIESLASHVDIEPLTQQSP
ncbi:MAG: MotA/TolQ/ExbB proton channel family protein [Phycisphaerales bacterium JB043]